MIKRAGFGGGCHWCTEAVFASLRGVVHVQQGWIASTGDNAWLSEGVIAEFDTDVISLHTLTAVHLYTHSSTARHSMRDKYRSGVYTFTKGDAVAARRAIKTIQKDFDAPIITQVLPFGKFEYSRSELLNYYYSNPQKPFCENYINPKLKLILQKFKDVANKDKLGHLYIHLNNYTI